MSDAAPVETRVLVVAPTWVGDAVMATPALTCLRDRLPGAFIGALVRPGVEQVLAGLDLFDEVHVDPRAGVMGPKRAAAKVRPRRYGVALLLTNSFSSALTVRMAGVPRRIGYDRDGRGLLLTDRIDPARRADTPPFDRSSTSPRSWAPVSACEAYMELVRRFLGDDSIPLGPMRLAVTDEERAAADTVLGRAGIAATESGGFAVLNPGGNNPAKRWPAERFAAIARRLREEHGLASVVAGSPGESDLADEVARLSEGCASAMPRLGLTLGSLKGVLGRCGLLVTNDTGPRHIAAALGAPVVTLFGPTDPRWTTIPCAVEEIVVADPTLPEEEVADDHPERMRIERIGVDKVAEAATRALQRAVEQG